MPGIDCKVYHAGMVSFSKKGTLSEFQKFISDVYSLPDDRFYSIWDLLTQEQRFTMRSLKGIRKKNFKKLKLNLLISLSWLMAIASRFHIEVEQEVWTRFPYLCSYCGFLPCKCSSNKSSKRVKVKVDESKHPSNLDELQKMFEQIYPSKRRTLAEAGVHLAEEMGEVAEAVHNYLGQHQVKRFQEVKLELADLLSCILGVANSANIQVANELAIQYKNNCHVCHKIPCACTFSKVVGIKS